MKRNKLISLTICIVLIVQTMLTNIVVAANSYPLTNVRGRPLNTAMSDKANFGIYGITSNGTGIANGVTPPGMTVPQQKKDGEWRYLGYNYEDKVITNSAYPGDYGMVGEKVGGYSYTWNKLNYEEHHYNSTTPALNEDSGDIKTAEQIGIDYCQLVEKATPDKPGSFIVWFKVPPYPGYPNGRLMYMTYVIPKNDGVIRRSHVYFREEGTHKSLISGLYEKHEYKLQPGGTKALTWTAKVFKGYKFTRSITSNNTSGGFVNEKRGEEGKTRSGSLSYDSKDDFNVMFYYERETFEPGEGTPGDIVFTPNETEWTNKGKTGESSGSYSVNVRYSGENPQVLQGVATIHHYEKIENPPDADGNATDPTIIDYEYDVPFPVTYTINNITVTGDASGSFSDGSGGNVFIRKEGENLNLSATGTWEEEYEEPTPEEHETITNIEMPTAPPDPTGSSGYYYIDWTTPITTPSATSTYWTNQGKPYGYPLSFNIYEKIPGSGLQNTSWSISDSSYYGRSQSGSLPDGIKGSTNVSRSLLDGMYRLSVNKGDIAGNRGNDYYGEYLVDLTDPDKAAFTYPNAVLYEGQYEYMCDFDNEIKVKYGDNLSGIFTAKYFWSQSTIQPSAVVMKNIPNGTTVDRIKTTKEVTLNIHDGAMEYKDLKKGKWYLHIYTRDRAGNVTRSVSNAIFVNKIEDFKSSFIHDLRWQYLFQDEDGYTWNDEKKKNIAKFKRNSNRYEVSELPLNGYDYNTRYGTNIKKGYFTEWEYNTYGFNADNARIDIYITYHFWNGSSWEKIGTSPYVGEERYNIFYETDGIHYFPLDQFPSNEGGKLAAETFDEYLARGGRSFERITGASKKPVKFYNIRSSTDDTNNELFLENIWQTRYAFPFAKILNGTGNYNSSKNRIINKSDVLTKPVLVNFEIVGTKTYGEITKKQYYTKLEDRWKVDPYYMLEAPYNRGNVMIIDTSKSSIDDTYVELN